MNRLINSVLISVVAFFGLLSAFVLAGLHGVDGDGGSNARIQAVTVAWQPAAGPGTVLAVTLALHHPGTVPTHASSVSYQTLVDGQTVDEGTAALDGTVAAGKESSLTFTSDLGEDFASSWWPHAADGQSSDLVVQGTLTIVSGDVQRSLPFEWTSTFRGDVGRLFGPLQDCGGAAASLVCLESTSTRWDGNTLVATVTLRNQGDGDLAVREGTLALRLAGQAVATGPVPAGPLPARSSEAFQVRLAFDAGALDRWWPGHVARCEASDAQATLRVDLEDASGWDAGTAAWETTSSTYTTAFVCEGPQ